MFFWLSKILWYLLNPLNLVFLGICLLAVLLWLNKVRAARILSSVMAVCAVLVTALPIGDLAIQHLENRFPANPVLPAHIDGVVVLGGVISPKLSKARGQPQLGDGMERITAVADIIRSSPNAKIILNTYSCKQPNNQSVLPTKNLDHLDHLVVVVVDGGPRVEGY